MGPALQPRYKSRWISLVKVDTCSLHFRQVQTNPKSTFLDFGSSSFFFLRPQLLSSFTTDIGSQELFRNLKSAPCQLSSQLCSTKSDDNSSAQNTFSSASTQQLASETVLTIKTGSSVVWDRLVVHLASPRPDIPNRLFFSDAELQFGNVNVKDILANVSEAVREDPAFKPYEELHRSLRDRIPPQKNFNHWTLDKSVIVLSCIKYGLLTHFEISDLNSCLFTVKPTDNFPKQNGMCPLTQTHSSSGTRYYDGHLHLTTVNLTTLEEYKQTTSNTGLTEEQATC